MELVKLLVKQLYLAPVGWAKYLPAQLILRFQLAMVWHLLCELAQKLPMWNSFSSTQPYFG